MSATGSPAGNPAPPASALIVLNGKTEAEMAALVPKLVKAVKVTAAQKRKVEIKAAELENEKTVNNLKLSLTNKIKRTGGGKKGLPTARSSLKRPNSKLH